jgi:hypothetical protein
MIGLDEATEKKLDAILENNKFELKEYDEKKPIKSIQNLLLFPLNEICKLFDCNPKLDPILDKIKGLKKDIVFYKTIIDENIKGGEICGKNGGGKGAVGNKLYDATNAYVQKLVANMESLKKIENWYINISRNIIDLANTIDLIQNL